MFGVTVWELLHGGKHLPYEEVQTTLHIISGVVTGRLKLRAPPPSAGKKRSDK